MAISKKKEEMTSIGVTMSTKEQFNSLVERINRDNRLAHGEKARKITHDDVLNELVTAYTKVGE